MINSKLAESYKSKVNKLIKAMNTKEINNLCKIIKKLQKIKVIYLYLGMEAVHQPQIILQMI